MHGGEGMRCVAHAALLAIALTAIPAAFGAGPDKLPRVGFCSPGIPESELVDYKHPIPQGLLAGMRERGWHHEKNYRLIFRTAVGRPGGTPACIESLVREPVDVIVVPGGVVAISKLAGSIPVVGGIAPSEASLPAVRDPRRNFTGVMRDASADLWHKQFALLKEVARVDRIVVMSPWEPAPDVYPGLQRERTDSLRKAEAAVGVVMDRWRLTSPAQIEEACAAIAARPRSGLVIGDNHVWVTWGSEPAKIIERTCVRRHRLPIMYTGVYGAAGPGVLMGYGPSFAGVLRLLPYFIDRILKGAKPSELPISTAEDYQLGLNLDVARQLGITFSPAILLRADFLFEEGRVTRDPFKSKSPY